MRAHLPAPHHSPPTTLPSPTTGTGTILPAGSLSIPKYPGQASGIWALCATVLRTPANNDGHRLLHNVTYSDDRYSNLNSIVFTKH